MSKRHRRRNKEAEKPMRDKQNWPPLTYTHDCLCGHHYSDGHPVSKCDCGRIVEAHGLFKESKR